MLNLISGTRDQLSLFRRVMPTPPELSIGDSVPSGISKQAEIFQDT